MSKGAQVAIVVINCLWLAPFTGGISIVVGIVGVLMLASDR